jgi:hypothetical protein
MARGRAAATYNTYETLNSGRNTRTYANNEEIQRPVMASADQARSARARGQRDLQICEKRRPVTGVNLVGTR